MPSTRRKKIFISSKEHGNECARDIQVGVTYVVPEKLKCAELAYRFLYLAGDDKIFFVNKVNNRSTNQSLLWINVVSSLFKKATKFG